MEGRDYRIERRAVLGISTEWTDTSVSVSGSGVPVNVTLPTDGIVRQFYRLVLVGSSFE